jgi:hypothetical protein
MSFCRLCLRFSFRLYNNLCACPVGPAFFTKRHILQCNFIFLIPKLDKLLWHIDINCTHGSYPRLSKNNIHIIHINGTKIKMQHMFIHSELQIFKKLNNVTLNPCALNILCKNLQSTNQLNIDKILLATRVNRNNNLLLSNASMNL